MQNLLLINDMGLKIRIKRTFGLLLLSILCLSCAQMKVIQKNPPETFGGNDIPEYAPITAPHLEAAIPSTSLVETSDVPATSHIALVSGNYFLQHKTVRMAPPSRLLQVDTTKASISSSKTKLPNPTGDASLMCGVLAYVVLGLVIGVTLTANLGILENLSILSLFLPISIVLAIFAWVLGSSGIKLAKSLGLSKSNAIIGKILGIVFFMLPFILLILGNVFKW
jgi:hypothetical protein